MAFDQTIYKGWTEGPFGVPMPDAIAKEIEQAAKELPSGEEYEYKRAHYVAKQSNELPDGERADISIISTASVDRDREVVLPKGIELTQFKRNPIVTWAHKYDQLPVGKASWIKYDKALDSLKAKTLYEQRPEEWKGEWFVDAVFAMVKSGTLRGKSIGFLPTKGHAPTQAEIKANDELSNVQWIFEKGILLEYAVAPVQSNPMALVEQVSKGYVTESVLELLGLELPEIQPEPEPDAKELLRKAIAEADKDTVEKLIAEIWPADPEPEPDEPIVPKHYRRAETVTAYARGKVQAAVSRDAISRHVQDAIDVLRGRV